MSFLLLLYTFFIRIKLLLKETVIITNRNDGLTMKNSMCKCTPSFTIIPGICENRHNYKHQLECEQLDVWMESGWL